MAAICSRVCADAKMGIAAMKKPALIKVPITLERVKRPRPIPLLISKPWLIFSLVTIRLDTLLFPSSMPAQLYSFLCIFDSDALGPGSEFGLNPFGGFAVAFRVVLITKQSRGQTFRTSGAFCFLLNSESLQKALEACLSAWARTTTRAGLMRASLIRRAGGISCSCPSRIP